jgi:hypothetical protein
MKNEGAFILDWVAYHLSIGVAQFLVYTNDCDDGTDAIWRRLAEMGVGAHVENDRIRARGVQKTALMRADDHPLVVEAEWLGCLDVDEFINVKHGEGRLDDLLAAAPDADMFMLAWRRFGAARIPQYRDAPVLEQFTRAAPEICPYPFHNYGAKSLWRRDAGYQRIGVHRPLDLAESAAPKVVNAVGAPLERYRDKGLWLNQTNAGYAGAQVNHYSLRSAESYLVKCMRGLPNSKITQLDLAYWAERNFNAVEDVSIHRRLPAMREKLAELKTDATLARLHDAAVAWHQQAIQTALADPALLKLYLTAIITETITAAPRFAAKLNPLVAKSWEAERADRKRRRDR